jgi:hypothetical protein
MSTLEIRSIVRLLRCHQRRQRSWFAGQNGQSLGLKTLWCQGRVIQVREVTWLSSRGDWEACPLHGRASFMRTSLRQIPRGGPVPNDRARAQRLTSLPHLHRRGVRLSAI